MTEKIIVDGNVTTFYLDGEKSLTITDLGNNRFQTENKFTKLIGSVVAVDDYVTETRLEKNYNKDKLGRWRHSKKLFEHHAGWFSYILQENGFVRKATSTR